MKNLVLVGMSHKQFNRKWLENISSELDCKILGLIDNFEDFSFMEYCDYIFSKKEGSLGFGKSRRISMKLGSELEKYCIITDGDGQYPIGSIKKAIDYILSNSVDVVIPQRKNKKLVLEKNSKILNRTPFEKLESIFALEEVNIEDLPKNIDAQPGLFAFKSSIVEKLLPKESGWLADWEITVNALKSTNYKLLPLSIDPSVQSESSFTWDNQLRKLRRFRKITDFNLKEVYHKNIEIFEEQEKKIIEEALSSL